MNQPSPKLLHAMKRATEEALHAARTGHIEAVHRHLGDREKMIATWFGFDPEQPLPTYEAGLVGKKTRVDDANLTIADEIRDLELRLERTLKHGMKCLESQNGALRRGEKYIGGVKRNFLPAKTGRRMDRTG